MSILKTMLNGQPLDHDGEHWKLKLDPPRVGHRSRARPAALLRRPVGGRPRGRGQGLRRLPDVAGPQEVVAAIIADMTARAAKYGRTLKFGYRAHVIVRDTEAEARARRRPAAVQAGRRQGAAIRAKSLDSTSVGVAAQAALRESAVGRRLCRGQSVDRRRPRPLGLRRGDRRRP